jgi:hypothetical protein
MRPFMPLVLLAARDRVLPLRGRCLLPSGPCRRRMGGRPNVAHPVMGVLSPGSSLASCFAHMTPNKQFSRQIRAAREFAAELRR